MSLAPGVATMQLLVDRMKQRRWQSAVVVAVAEVAMLASSCLPRSKQQHGTHAHRRIKMVSSIAARVSVADPSNVLVGVGVRVVSSSNYSVHSNPSGRQWRKLEGQDDSGLQRAHALVQGLTGRLVSCNLERSMGQYQDDDRRSSADFVATSCDRMTVV